MDSVVYPILRKHFKRDEFLGRINETLIFVPFGHQDLQRLATLELEKWKKRAHERHKIELQWDQSVVDNVISDYNVSYGARSIKHGVEKRVVNQLAKAHERDEIGEGSVVQLYSTEGGEIGMRIEKAREGKAGGFFGGFLGK
jgi:ATP-dependent Clp protease ATP-binding subunit ClpB